MAKIAVPLSRAEVIKKCEQLLTSFNPIITTVDCYAAENLGPDCEGMNADPDKAFIKQVFYGCITCKKALKVFLTHFYGDKAAVVLRSDYQLYRIMAYLLLFRLDELGWESLKRFVAEQEPGKMFHLLSYVFLGSALQRGVKQEWLGVLDIDYIDNVVWTGLQKYRREAENLCASLEVAAFGAEAAEATKAKAKEKEKHTKAATTPATVPQAPKLHPPRRRRVPMPLLELNAIRIGEDPAYMYDPHKGLSASKGRQEQRRQQAREATLKKYDDSMLFPLHETKSTIEQRRQEREQQRQETLDFDRPSVVPVPQLPENGASVRLNACAILREDALFKRKREHEAQLLKAYEKDLRDCIEYYRWQTHARAHDQSVNKARVEERRVLGRLSCEEAKAALLKLHADNHLYAQAIKHEAKLMDHQRHAEAQMAEAMNRQLVKEVAEVREKAPKVAKENMFYEHQDRSRALREERAQAWARKLAEDARLAEEKADRIRRLKADNEVIRKQVKVFDPTTTSGQGFLDEIPLLEVWERLKMNKLKQQEREEAKRQEILLFKAKKQEQLLQRVCNIRRLREAAFKDAQEGRAKREVARKEAEEKARRDREARQITLLEELEAARVVREEERRKLAEEEKKVREEQRRLHEQATARHQRLEEAMRAGAAADKAGASEAKAAARQAKIDEIRASHRRPKSLSLPPSAPHVPEEDELEMSKRELQARLGNEDLEKRRRVQQARKDKEALRAQMLELNPYAGSINERSVQNARARRVTTHNKRSETPCESQNEKQMSDEWAEGDKAEAVSHVGTGKVTHEVTEPVGMPQAA